jgi:hypothetical protein
MVVPCLEYIVRRAMPAPGLAPGCGWSGGGSLLAKGSALMLYVILSTHYIVSVSVPEA